MAPLSQIHSLVATSLVCGRSLLLLSNLEMSLSISTMACSSNPKEHRTHTSRSSVYRLLLLIEHSLMTLSLSFGCLTCIFETSMTRTLILCRISDFLMTTSLHELGCTSLNIFEWQHWSDVRTYYPSLRYPTNKASCRI